MVSQQELDRRYARVRQEMEANGCQALIICGREDRAGAERGPVHYLAGVSPNAALYYLVFGPSKPILVYPESLGSHWLEATGALGEVRVNPDLPQGVYDVLAEQGLSDATIGIVGYHEIVPLQQFQQMETKLSSARLLDADDWYNAIRSVKSDEELAAFESTAVAFRAAMDVIQENLRPGITEREIVAKAFYELRAQGCPSGFLNIARSGGAKGFHPATGDVIEKTDCIGFDMELRGPEHYGIEVTRYFSFGAPPADIKERFNIQREVFLEVARQVVPGATSDDVMAALRRAYESRGFFLAGPVGWGPLLYQIHGIGLDMVEPPYVPGTTRPLEENMVLSLHPRMGPERPDLLDMTVLDNLIVKPGGSLLQTYPDAFWTEI